MIIGIDLGTSNSLVTYWNGEEAVVIPNEFGERLTPSIVSLSDDEELIVGAIAKERMFSHPHLTVGTFKSFMGTKKKYRLGKWTLSPVELSSLVLKKLKRNAEDYFSEPVTEAIISVPAYFNNIQREATLEAAQLAGLEVRGLISEPTAAAIAYGIDRDLDQLILVCDLGGGTYDVSLMEFFDGLMQVEAISGDIHLGGEDFTQVIFQDILEKADLVNTELTNEEKTYVYKKAESIKIGLETKPDISLDLRVRENVFQYDLSYANYEELCQGLLNRMKNPLLRVLSDSQNTVQDIDKIILVGGATKAKLVRDYITRLFKKFPYYDLDADEIIALGVGIEGSLKDGSILQEQLMLTDVCAHTMGVETVSKTDNGVLEGIYSPIIERNSPIPISREHVFYTTYDGQRAVKFGIYQGEFPRVEDNVKIGEIELALKRAPESYPITVRFTYDVNGLLEVIVTDSQTNKSISTVIEENPGNLSKEEIQQALRKLKELKIHPRDKAENQLLLARIDRLYVEKIDVERAHMGMIRSKFEAAIQGQDEKKIEKLRQEIQEYLDFEEQSSFDFFDE